MRFRERERECAQKPGEAWYLQAQLAGSEYFEIPLGRMELAEYLCADRSALTRELNSMRQDGILDYDRNMFRLK